MAIRADPAKADPSYTHEHKSDEPKGADILVALSDASYLRSLWLFDCL